MADDSKSVFLDLMFPEVVDEWLEDVLPLNHGVTYEEAASSGPGGGWPIYKFTGPAENIDRLERAYEGE